MYLMAVSEDCQRSMIYLFCSTRSKIWYLLKEKIKSLENENRLLKECLDKAGILYGGILENDSLLHT